MDIVQSIKNKLLIIGLNKADGAIDGKEVMLKIADQIQEFTNDANQTTQIMKGPIRNFVRELYEGTLSQEELVPELMQWIASLPKKKCEIVVKSTPRLVNDTKYNEEPAKYMANPCKGFIQSIMKKIKGGRK